jgi:DNA-binding response OmpR family regulator
MNILLAEDDRMIGENIQIALSNEGIAVTWVRDGNAAERVLGTHSFDAVLLDLGLPGKDGIEVLRSMRSRSDLTPVLILTARDTVPQRVLGLKTGADDYLIKPFDLEELMARLQAVIRRTRGGTTTYRVDNVVVNLETRQVFVDGEQLVLPSREWAVLEALLMRPGAILSRAQLEERLYGLAGDVESNAVEVYVHGLRKKLGQQFVINVRGLGYMVRKS